MTKYEKGKAKVTNIKELTQTVVMNFERLLESIALLTLAIFAVYAVQNYELAKPLSVVLLIAAAVIAVRGGIEFLRHLAQKPINR